MSTRLSSEPATTNWKARSGALFGKAPGWARTAGINENDPISPRRARETSFTAARQACCDDHAAVGDAALLGLAGTASPGRRLVVFLLALYKAFLSPLLPSSCKFYPSCSMYAKEAVERHGVARGLGLALRRLLRCRPFSRGGYDPVPDA